MSLYRELDTISAVNLVSTRWLTSEEVKHQEEGQYDSVLVVSMTRVTRRVDATRERRFLKRKKSRRSKDV